VPERKPEKMIVMGRISAPFGVKGWVKVHPYTPDPKSLLEYSVWWLGKEASQGWTEQPVILAQMHGSGLVAWFEGVADRQAADRLKGVEVALPRSAMPAPQGGEYYLADLLGLDVINRKGESLGRIVDFLEAGPNLVLKIAAQGRERLIPFAESVVDQVEFDQGRIRVDWGADY
jgi:16S rRNA processing protein RimM